MNKIMVALFFLFYQGSLIAGNLYVEQGGTGANCSEQDPCGVIQEAVEQTVAGDTILVGAGVYVENVFIQTPNITLRGVSRNHTIIETAGGRDGALGNAGNPLDAIIEVRAANVIITKLTLVHPRGHARIREAAIFAWKGSPGLQVTNCKIERKRINRIDEPTIPGSRGVFIFAGPGSLVAHNKFKGNYQDHVHLPSSGVTVLDNTITGASRAGISVMDPVSFVGPNVFDSTNNVLIDNQIKDSLDDGIHIQGDATKIINNSIIGNGGYGIYLCGDGRLGGGCYFPGELAISEKNLIIDNKIHNNSQGTIGDDGINNTILHNN
ncbi:MAG: nitrous oxide reductase family maturation protein NosD [Thiohalomonadales bacterium]